MLHLLRTAAGIRDLAELQEVQAHFKTRIHKNAGSVVFISTRNTPKRMAELLDGGSVYWIVKNIIQARQKIIDIETVVDQGGERLCQIFLGPAIIRVMPIKQKAVQGWRYFEAAKAPRDLGVYKNDGKNNDTSASDEVLAQELKAAGLI